MTNSKYEFIIKLLIEELERCKDEIFDREAQIDMLQEELNTARSLLFELSSHNERKGRCK